MNLVFEQNSLFVSTNIAGFWTRRISHVAFGGQEELVVIDSHKLRSFSLKFTFTLLCASVSAHAQNLSGVWTGTRTETNGGVASSSNQVLMLYQLSSGDPVVGTLTTYWPGSTNHWNAVASGTVSGSALTLTWTIIPASVSLPPGSTACSATETLTLSSSGEITTATVPSYHPCGDADATVASYLLTLVGWEEMLGQDDSGGTSYPCFCGDPIDVSIGNVFETVKDYETAGPNKLSFIRYYNSYSPPTPAASLVYVNGVPHWTTNYDRSLVINATRTQVIAHRPDGQQLTFNLASGVWKPNSDVDITLSAVGDDWTLTGHDDTAESYLMTQPANEPGAARLTSIKARNGYTQTSDYNSGGHLSSVTDSYDRKLNFTYTNGLLTEVTTPDSLVLTYAYNSSGVNPGVDDRLASVSYNTSPETSQRYGYGETPVPVGGSPLPFALTSITDENGDVYSSFTYDKYGRALTSQHAGGADLTTVTYNDSAGTRTVTNALGQQETYTFVSLQGTNKVVQISRKADGAVVAATRSFTYDGNGFTASATDWDGHKTTYVNNVHGEPTTINEAVGTTVARTTTIAYNATWVHLPATITTPGLTTGFTYDNDGEVLTRTLTDTTATTSPYATKGETHTWTNTWSNSLQASVKTPNGNITRYGHDTSGALTSTTDAKGHVTSITAHTGGGLPETIVDLNGVTTKLIYSPRQWLTTSTVSGTGGSYATGWVYDKAGNLTKTTLPDNSYLENTYDDAHRLVRVTDALGNYTSYTLDELGDRTQTNVYKDGGSTPTRKRTDTFDSLGRILLDTAGAGQTTTFTHDSNGSVLTVTDGLKHKTTNTYDALNRLSTITDANGGITATTYDSHDRVINVKDANGDSTVYLRDGFGDVIELTSPDSGKTVFHFDADANLTSKTDALGIVTNQTFDALDRRLTTTYPADSSKNVAYTYDQTGTGFSFGIGRLTSVKDAVGSLTREYDERGNLSSEKRVNGTSTLTTAYTYDGASRVASITYPDGTLVKNGRNAAGYLSSVSSIPSGAKSSTTLATIGHLPFGPISSVTYGNGIAETWDYDEDYRASSITDELSGKNVQKLSYAYDDANNVHTITDAVNSADGQTLEYDVINRLISAVSEPGGYGNFDWTYDKVGNRLTQKSGSTTTTYGYTSGTNRLASITVGGVETTVSTNADGNITNIPPANSNSLATFTYSVANRLASVTGSPVAATFAYDWAGQRFSKTNNGSSPILYSYMQGGTLIEENNSGKVTDYIYADGRPIADLQSGEIPTADRVNYILADRLGTPQLASNSSGTTDWSTTYQPFGTTGTPDASIIQNLRFPGQYADQETGLSYNLNRDYMPNLGRYLESDPIGLAGGMNPYLYVRANPGRFTDRLGFQFCEDACVGEYFVFRLFITIGSDAGPALDMMAAQFNSALIRVFGSAEGAVAVSGTSAYLAGSAELPPGQSLLNLEELYGQEQAAVSQGSEFLGQTLTFIWNPGELLESTITQIQGNPVIKPNNQPAQCYMGNDFGDLNSGFISYF
jgi:RHS repeat-associated protein